jgi:RNA polymerase sigma factor (sigma-70 family)
MSHREQRQSDPNRLARNRGWVQWLLRERRTGLRIVAHRNGIAEQDTEDVVQAALLGVLRAFPGPDDESSVFSYAARAVQNTALKAHRRAQRKETHNVPIEGERAEGGHQPGTVIDVSDPAAADPLEQVIAREAADELGARLAKLPAEQRAALMLSAAGYGTAEIAAALGLSERAARKRIQHGNRALRDRR